MIVVPQDRIRDYRAKGWWGDDTLDDLFRRHLKAHPDAEALIDPFNAADIMGGQPERLTWAEADASVDRLAAVFHAHGLKKDDVLVVQLPNINDLSLTYLAAARLELNRLLGLPPQTMLTIAPATPFNGMPDADGLFALASTERADLRALRDGYDAQEAALRKAVLDQFPSLNLTVNAGRDTGKNVTLGPAIGFTLPLWNRNRGGVAVETATRAALKAEYEARLFQTRAEIAAAISGLKVARAQFGAQQAGLDGATRFAAKSRKAATRGDLSDAAAQTAEQVARDRQMQSTQSAQDMAEQMIALELLTGMPREQWK